MRAAGTPSVADTAQLEGWRRPVAAALQPVVVLDGHLTIVAASPAATHLLRLPPAGRPLVEAEALREVADRWDATPFMKAMKEGRPQRSRLELPSAGLACDVVVSPLFGPTGAIGAMAFLTAA